VTLKVLLSKRNKSGAHEEVEGALIDRIIRTQSASSSYSSESTTQSSYTRLKPWR